MSDEKKISLQWPLIDGILQKSDTTYLGPDNNKATYIDEVYKRSDGQNTKVTKGIYSDGYRFIDMITGDDQFTQGYRPDGSINYTLLPEEYKKHRAQQVPKGFDGLKIKRALNFFNPFTWPSRIAATLPKDAPEGTKFPAIVVDKKSQTLRYYDENGNQQLSSIVSTGANKGDITAKAESKTPEGQFKIGSKSDKVKEGVFGDNLFMGLSGTSNSGHNLVGRGFGIHGDANKPLQLGRCDSHGCVRVEHKNLEELYNLAEPGTNVYIRKQGGNMKLIPKGAKGWYASEMQAWSPEKMKQILKQYGKEGLSDATYAYLVKRVGEPQIVTTQSSTMPQLGKTDGWGQNAMSKIKDFFTNNTKTKDEWNQANNTVTINGKIYSTTDKNDITELQNYLINNGYNLGVSKGTGYFGNKTRQALTQHFNTKSSLQSNLQPVKISEETSDIRKLIGDLVNYSTNPYLKDSFAKIDQSSEFGDNDREVIKQLQARYNLPVTGKLDDATLERFKHENSFIGKVENVVESFNKPGSVGRQFSRAITQAILPEGWVKEKQLYRDDFTKTQQQQFDYILKRASQAKPDVYSLSGAQYSDGYAPGHYGADPNLIRRGVDILSGNDQQSGAFSIGGATVSTHIFPNGKRGSLLTDVYDFNSATPDYIVQQQNAIKNDSNLTEQERAQKLAELNTSVAAIEAQIAKGQGDQHSTATYYGLYEDGTPMTQEDIQWALSDRSNYPGKKRKDGSTYRPRLAKHADINDLMYTTWTGSGNTYKGSTTSKEHPTVLSQIVGDAKNFWNTKIRKEQIGGCLKYISK